MHVLAVVLAKVNFEKEVFLDNSVLLTCLVLFLLLLTILRSKEASFWFLFVALVDVVKVFQADSEYAFIFVHDFSFFPLLLIPNGVVIMIFSVLLKGWIVANDAVPAKLSWICNFAFLVKSVLLDVHGVFCAEVWVRCSRAQ